MQAIGLGTANNADVDPVAEAHGERRFDEPRWHASLAVIAALALYITLPPKLTFGPTWFFPAIVLVLLVPLLIFSPTRHQESRTQRIASIALIAVTNFFNVVSVVLLVWHIIGREQPALSGSRLLVSGAQIWLTNVLVFAMWYWEIDGGGCDVRAHARSAAEVHHADFLFPQMTVTAAAPKFLDPHWKPLFIDYLYLSFTNALAFSPTDTMPLTRMAKTLMLIESGVSFVSIAVIVSRSINIIS